MAITLSTAARNASVDARTALVPGGYINIKDGSTVLAVIVLQDPAFGAAASGSATARGGDDATAVSASNPLICAEADDGGTPDSYEVYDADDDLIWSGAAAEMTVSPATIVAGQEVRITGWTHAQSA